MDQSDGLHGVSGQDNLFSVAVSPTGGSVEQKNKSRLSGQTREKSPPGTDFTTTYLPSGQAVKTETLDKRNLEKYHVDNWQKFANPSYNTILMTDKYHVVKEKKSPRIYIECNKPVYGPRNGVGGRNPELHIASFRNYSPRKPIICSDAKGHSVDLNASRFEPINKDPNVLTRTRRATGITFDSHKPRTELFPAGDMSTFYDANKEKVMGRLTRGYFNLKT